MSLLPADLPNQHILKPQCIQADIYLQFVAFLDQQYFVLRCILRMDKHGGSFVNWVHSWPLVATDDYFLAQEDLAVQIEQTTSGPEDNLFYHVSNVRPTSMTFRLGYRPWYPSSYISTSERKFKLKRFVSKFSNWAKTEKTHHPCNSSRSITPTLAAIFVTQ